MSHDQDQMAASPGAGKAVGRASASRWDGDAAQVELFFDSVTRELYQAAAGAISWLQPLNRLVSALDAWVIHVIGADKRDGSVLFSYEAGPGIMNAPEAALDYIRTYRQIDPRVEMSMHLPLHQWFACHEHFDDAYVAQSPFYQEFLIPYGARYVFLGRVMEDHAKSVVFAILHSDRPLDAPRRAFSERLGRHLGDALAVQHHLQHTQERASVGYELLARMRQPILLIDGDRNITFRNRAAQTILDEGDLLREHGTMLICGNVKSSADLTLIVRDLALTAYNDRSHVAMAADADRRSVKLTRNTTGETVVLTLLALRPEHTQGAFGSTSQALVTIYAPGRMPEPDPFLIAATFNLTPSEARLAARLCGGASLKDYCTERQVSMPTVRSQLGAIFVKTGTKRQSDLVRLLITASQF